MTTSLPSSRRYEAGEDLPGEVRDGLALRAQLRRRLVASSVAYWLIPISLVALGVALSWILPATGDWVRNAIVLAGVVAGIVNWLALHQLSNSLLTAACPRCARPFAPASSFGWLHRGPPAAAFVERCDHCGVPLPAVARDR